MPPKSIRRFSTVPSLRGAAGTLLGSALGFVPSAYAQTAAQPVQLPPVAVQGAEGGYQTQVPALGKLTQPLLDTPQSVNVLPKKLLQDQGDVAVRDALRNVPGISLGAGEAGAQGDNLTLRGFSARNDFYLDGMRDFGSYTRDPFDLESIEVLKGPASVLFGRGSTGGVINQVTKHAVLPPITSGTLTFGTDGTKRFTSDIGRPIDGLEGSAVRLNLMGNLNGTAGRDDAEYRRFGVAPSVVFGLGTDTRLTFDYLHQQEDDTPDYGLPWLYGAPANVSRGNFYGFKDSDYLRTNVDIGTIKLEHDINDSLTVRTQFRYGNYARSIRVTEPQIVYTGITPSTPLSQIGVTRNMIAVSSTETFLQDQTDVLARFKTGIFEHDLVSGVELGTESSSPDRTRWTGVPGTNLLNPVAVPFTGIGSLQSQSRTTGQTAALYGVDTIKITDQWQLIGGVRWDDFRVGFDQYVAPVSHFSREDSLVSWRGGIVYKPVPMGSFYFAYGTSFNPSAESLSLASSTADLAPEKNETYEVGTKWDVLNGGLSLTGALFQIEKTNARVPDPNNSLFNILGGNQRVRGFEVGAAGHLTERWEVYSGYAFLDSETVSSTTASSVGRALQNTPKHSLNVWTAYELPWYGATIGGGAQYLSSRLASSSPASGSNAFNLAPGYVTFQAMAKVPIRPGLTAQVNATNLADVKYYDLLHPAHVVPGSGRTVLFSLSFSL
ncbi:MAG TPA: TonB-dependent siderophore receptor [Rhodopila sp.]